MINSFIVSQYNRLLIKNINPLGSLSHVVGLSNNANKLSVGKIAEIN